MTLRAEHTVSQQDVSLSASRPVRVQRLAVEDPVRPHDHAYHEICLLLGGEATHQTTDGQTPVRTGRVIVVSPRAVHGLAPRGTIEVANVYYLAEWLAADLSLLWPEPGLVPLFLSGSVMNVPRAVDVIEFDVSEAELSAVSRDLKDIELEADQPAASQVVIRGAFLKILARLARAHARQSPRAYGTRPEVWKCIQHVESLVQAARPFDLNKLADQLSLSPDYLGRVFSKSMGRTIGEYFQLRRVHRACQLLLDPRYSVTDVALELGYADTPHLCRTFKRLRHMSPTAYRDTYAPDTRTAKA